MIKREGGRERRDRERERERDAESERGSSEELQPVGQRAAGTIEGRHLGVCRMSSLH